MKTYLFRRWVLSLVSLLLVTALVLSWQLGRIALRPVAMTSGWLLLALVLALTFFNARKKLPFLPLLSASIWLQIHLYVGWISCGVFVLHTGVRLPDGPLELVLAAVFVLVALSGVFGLWLSRWLPPHLTRSGESLIYERIPMLRHQLLAEGQAIVRKAEAETRSTTLADFYLRVLSHYFARIPGVLAPLTGDDPDFHRVKLELTALRRFLDARELAFADQVGELLELKRNLDAQLAGQRLLKLWLFAHIPLTYGLWVFIAAHVWLVLQYSHRM
jgi:hypothetical protein